MRSTTSASSGRCGLTMRATSANGRSFLGNVDPDGTPRDAASAAYATAAAVLVMPAAELVRQPLAVARAGVGTDRNTVNVAVPLGETGIPLAHVQAVTAVERGLVRFAVAKTGRAYRGAIAAGETTLSHFFPAWMREIRKKYVAQIACGQAPCLPPG